MIQDGGRTKYPSVELTWDEGRLLRNMLSWSILFVVVQDVRSRNVSAVRLLTIPGKRKSTFSDSEDVKGQKGPATESLAVLIIAIRGYAEVTAV